MVHLKHIYISCY